MTDESLTDESVHLLTGAYALDALTNEERATFLAHLEGCDACAAETADLLATAAMLALLTEEPAPAHLRDAVLREVARTPQAAPSAEAPAVVVDLDARRRTRRRWVASVAGAVAAAAAIAAGVFALGDGDDPVGDILAAGDARTFAGDVSGGGEATLVVSDSEAGGVITFAGLPDPGEGRAYQMWLITGDAAPMPEETFEPSDGNASVLLEGAPDADAVAVTIEPEGGSTTPTAPILAVIPIDS